MAATIGAILSKFAAVAIMVMVAGWFVKRKKED
jgi:hypothetical protein